LKAGQFEKAELYIYGAAKGRSFMGSKGDDTLSVYSESSEGGITINGGKGDDTLSSGGNNTLIGGAGSDTFVLHNHDSPDIILDFTAKDFLFISEYFESTRDSNIDVFNLLVVGSTPVATSAKAQFLYDVDDGRLLFDSNGTEAGGESHIATFTSRPTLKASSFILDF
jgi:Ca2+-binding RTX toxin-like protein